MDKDSKVVSYQMIFENDDTTSELDLKLKGDMNISLENFYIDIKSIIENHNIKIDEIELEDDDSGRYLKEESRIIINKKHSENRQRFTLAHEFSHHILGHDSSHRSNNADNYLHDYGLLSKERDANNLAANLIMPKVMIVALYEKFLEDNDLSLSKTLNYRQKEDLYNYISRKLKVSKSAVGYRLLNLGLI